MKLTMMEFSRIAATLLALPRKNRDQLELLLIEKRMLEDASKASDVNSVNGVTK